MPDRVGQSPVVQHLEQHVEDVRVRLLDLVEQHDRVRPAADLLREHAAFLVADVAGRGAEETGHRELLHVLGHVHTDQRVLVAEQVFGERARELGLADAGRAQEDERADRTLGVLEAGARAADGARDRNDRVVLADDPAVQGLLHAGELGRLLLLELRQRDAGPPRDDILDVVLADGLGALALVLLPLALQLFLAVPEQLLLLAEGGRLLELLRLEVHVLFADDALDLFLDLLDLGRRRERHEPGP